MRTLKSWFMRRFRLLFRAYPEGWPLVYICSRNGVTGVVRAEDFDTEVHRFRKLFAKHNDWPQVPIRPMVFPIFLFGPHKSNIKRDFRTGDLTQLADLLADCVAEERSFLVPDAYHQDMIPLCYPNVNGCTNIWEETGREGSRFMIHRFAEVQSYILDGQPLKIYGNLA